MVWLIYEIAMFRLTLFFFLKKEMYVISRLYYTSILDIRNSNNVKMVLKLHRIDRK